MKVKCLNCGTIIDIEESEYPVGIEQTIECPLCQEIVSFTIKDVSKTSEVLPPPVSAVKSSTKVKSRLTKDKTKPDTNIDLEDKKNVLEEAIKRVEEEAVRRTEREWKERNRRKRTLLYFAFAIILVLAIIILYPTLGNSSDKSDNVEEKPIVENPLQQSDKSDDHDNSPSNDSYDNVLSVRYLTESDLAGKSKKDLEIMRNSIYARYGYKFKRDDLLDYFSRYSWYRPITNDMGIVYNKMNDKEKYNIDFIKKHE